MFYKDLANKKFKRLFVFGCSFTHYFWPTWSNILSKHYQDAEFYNLGKSGAGNQFISLRVAEANERWNFNSEDLVAIMWTSFSREDRYINNKWETHGSVYWNSFYTEEFRKSYVDFVGCMIRDLGCISLTKGLLKSTGCSVINLASVPLSFKESTKIVIPKEYEELFQNVINLYKHHFDDMPVSLYDWQGSEWITYHKYYAAQWNEVHNDPHPTPEVYLKYLQEQVMPVSSNAIQYANDVQNLVINSKDKTEITNYFNLAPYDPRMF